jgi:MFS family permease
MIARDKKLHLLAGGIIGLICSAYGSFIWSVPAGLLLGCIISSVAGAAKELVDEERGGQVEFADFAFTVVGGVFGSVLGAALGSLIGGWYGN